MVRVARIALGLLIFVFGLNGMLHFLPVPPSPPEAEAFRQALVDSGYMLPLWKGVEFLGAALLLADAWVPFALVILTPVLINIFLFHWFLAPAGLGLAIVMLALTAFLAWNRREAFADLFT
jgi:hypothetical protein